MCPFNVSATRSDAAKSDNSERSTEKTANDLHGWRMDRLMLSSSIIRFPPDNGTHARTRLTLNARLAKIKGDNVLRWAGQQMHLTLFFSVLMIEVRAVSVGNNL